MGLNPHAAMLWGKTFFPFGECRQTGTSGVAGNSQANRPLGWTGNVVGYVAPNCAAAHYGCAEGCDRQRRQRVPVTGPVGWIWVLRLMKGGVEWVRWGGLSASLVMLKQQLH